MSAARNKATIRQLYTAWNVGRMDEVAQFIAPIFTDHAVPVEYAYGREGFARARALGAQALHEVFIQIDDLLAAEAGCIVAFVTIAATQVGPYKVIPYTGKPRRLTWKAISVMRLERGMLVEHWECADIVPMLHEIHAEIVVPATQEQVA